MTVSPGVVVPAIPPRPPQLSLINSAVRPDDTSDPSTAALDPAQMADLPADLRAEIAANASGLDGRPMWVRGFTYAPENHWPGELRDACDQSTPDIPPLPAPQGLAGAPSNTGGSLTAAASPYSYGVTAVNANGQTTALPAISVSIASGSSGSVVLTWQPVGDSAGVTYNVYGRASGSVGLLASVGPFDDDQTPTWTDTGSGSAGAAPPVSNTTGGIGSYGNLPINTIVPFLVIAEDSCSTFGFDTRDFKGRALRLLENATPQAIEHEFWTGTLAQAHGYPNRYLADANCVDLTPGTVPSVARGQQILQDYLATTGFGGQGMIHCQPQTAPNLLNARRVGPYLLDVFDNIIVPGVGYPGTGPVANANFTPPSGQAWMYCSDLVMVRAEKEGTVFPDSMAEALDWGQGGMPNTLRFRGEKFAAAYFDGAVQAAVRVELPS